MAAKRQNLMSTRKFAVMELFKKRLQEISLVVAMAVVLIQPNKSVVMNSFRKEKEEILLNAVENIA